MHLPRDLALEAGWRLVEWCLRNGANEFGLACPFAICSQIGPTTISNAATGRLLDPRHLVVAPQRRKPRRAPSAPPGWNLHRSSGKYRWLDRDLTLYDHAEIRLGVITHEHISVGLSLAFGALALALVMATARTEIRVIVRARRLGLASSPKPRRPLRDRPRPSPSRRPGLRSVQACST